MEKQVLVFKLFFLSSILNAQNANKIKVQKVKWNVAITSEDTVFWIGKNNLIQIDVKGGLNYGINIQGGTIHKIMSGYIIKVKQEGAVTISVYEKLANNKMNVLHTELFYVKQIPPPHVFVCGVAADSVIDKLQIINENILTAYDAFYKLNLSIVGFDVVFSAKGKTEILSSSNNKFTIGMRNRIHCLPSGTLLAFENISCLMPDGSISKLKPFELFISETNKYKVGYSVIGL